VITGIDCASHQGVINWSAVAASGTAFAYVKFNEGTSSSYPTAAAQFNGASAAGLVTGAYHYAQPAPVPIGQRRGLRQAAQSPQCNRRTPPTVS